MSALLFRTLWEYRSEVRRDVRGPDVDIGVIWNEAQSAGMLIDAYRGPKVNLPDMKLWEMVGADAHYEPMRYRLGGLAGPVYLQSWDIEGRSHAHVDAGWISVNVDFQQGVSTGADFSFRCYRHSDCRDSYELGRACHQSDASIREWLDTKVFVGTLVGSFSNYRLVVHPIDWLRIEALLPTKVQAIIDDSMPSGVLWLRYKYGPGREFGYIFG